MSVTTSLLRLTVNCKDHGDNFFKLEGEPCKTCLFLIHYNQKIAQMNKELDGLTTELEDHIKEGKVVAVTVGRKFSIGVL